MSAVLVVSCKDQKRPEQKPAGSKALVAADRPSAPKPDVPAEHVAAAKTSTEPAPPQPNANPAAAAHGLIVEGEHFTPRVVRDQQQGLVLSVFQAPESWRDQSQVVWNYAHVENPVERTLSVENPNNDEALYAYPAARYVWCEPNYGLSNPGQNTFGQIDARPVPPLQALTYFVRQARAGFPKLQFVGYKELPELPAALHQTAPQNQKWTGLAVKVTYERNGHPIEEEFYCIPYSNKIPYDGPQGRSWQNNWGLDSLHSFRAPLGALDKRRAIFATIAKSGRPNPAWQQRCQAIQTYLNDQFNRQLQAGYDRIAAAGRLSRQISANNDAMIASIDRQLASSRAGSGGSGGSQARSGADNFDDYIRGVETVNDPYYGASQHSSNEKYHWTDGYGTYRNSNDPSFDPNRNENGNWQLMEPVR
jgi:hypothetical protein